jgi:tetratricopeptide (TPR) repeat protein
MGLKPTLVAASIAFVVSAVASQFLPGGGAAPTAAATLPSKKIATGTSYASLLDAADRRIDAMTRRAEGRGEDWLIRMHLANALFDRASLTHRIEDYTRVDDVLDEAFAIVADGSGPLMVAARFNISIHRLELAEHYLDKVDRRAVPRRDDALLAKMMRGQIALQRGQYDEAYAALSEVAEVVPSVAAVELALYHAKTGDLDRAEPMLAEALERTPAKDPRRRAWIMLQLGILALDRGAPLVALEHLMGADAEVDGWWLVQEHLADAHDRLGNHAQAIAILEGLVESTELPQHMDALALVYRHAGRESDASAMIDRAAAAWERQLAAFPESATGHALQHELQFGDAGRALELALANHALRPGGDAAVALARAYMKSGRASEALEVAERTLATKYRSAGLHDVAAKAHAALGHASAATEQETLRDAINPSYTGEDHTH